MPDLRTVRDCSLPMEKAITFQELRHAISKLHLALPFLVHVTTNFL